MIGQRLVLVGFEDYQMDVLRRITGLVLLLSVIGGGLAIYCFVCHDNRRELERRASEINRYDFLVGEIVADPANQLLYYEFIVAKERDNPWDKTQMLAQMAHLGEQLRDNQQA